MGPWSGAHRPNRLCRRLQSSPAGGFDPEIPFAATAPRPRRFADGGSHVSLAFEAIERGIHGTDGKLTAQPILDFPPHRHPVGGGAEADQCEQDDAFQRTEEIAARHSLNLRLFSWLDTELFYLAE